KQGVRGPRSVPSRLLRVEQAGAVSARARVPGADREGPGYLQGLPADLRFPAGARRAAPARPSVLAQASGAADAAAGPSGPAAEAETKDNRNYSGAMSRLISSWAP